MSRILFFVFMLSIQSVYAQCDTPTNLTMVSIGTTNAVASWSAVTGAVKYNYAVLSPAAVPPSAATITTALSVNIMSLNPSTDYKFCINTDCSTSSSTWICKSFTTKTSSTSITSPYNNERFAIFPNPATNTTTITVQNYIPGSLITVYSTCGMVMATAPVTSASTPLDVSHYPAGMYMIKYTNANGTYYQKLLRY